MRNICDEPAGRLVDRSEDAMTEKNRPSAPVIEKKSGEKENHSAMGKLFPKAGSGRLC